MTENVLLTRPRQGVLQLTLNRPEKLNAITDAMLDRLIGGIAEAERDDAIRAVVLSGSGRAFSAGADVGTLAAMDAGRFQATIARFMTLARAMHDARKPVVAAVQGPAMAGGFELAVLAHVRIAAEDARFGLPDTALGLSPTSGMTWLLPRLIGWGRAVDLTLSGRVIDAAEAERIGLVARVVAADGLLDAALSYAEAIAAAPVTGVALTQQLYAESTGGSFADATRRETEAELACFAESETKARFRAFLERRRK
jgi:enoyl-CoA hydratase/carnithine racemase